MKTIKKRLGEARRPVAENKAFVTLVRVAQEDPEIRTQLQGILSLDAFHRKSALNTFLEQLRYKGAPEVFVSAIAALLDDGVADKVLTLLKNK